MKKLVLVLTLTFLSLTSATAQNGSMEVSPYLGAPVGDAEPFGFNAGATFAYYFDVIPRLKVGGLVGVDHFFGRDYRYRGNDFDKADATFIPIAASAKFNITDRLFAGLDLGYAIGVSDAAGDGGFLARPRFGFSFPIVDIYGYYKAINYRWDPNDGPENWDDKYNLGSVGVGAAFKF